MSRFQRPLVGYRFEVKFDNGLFGGAGEASFAEVSGINFEIPVEEVTEGGENRFKHRLPRPVSYQNLVLKRGIIPGGSELALWINSIMMAGIDKIITRTILVSLLDEHMSPQMSWLFNGAYPTKYEVSGLKADSSQISVETIEFTYRYFNRIQ